MLKLELGSENNRKGILELLRAFHSESSYKDTKFDPKKVLMMIDGVSKDKASSLVLVAQYSGKPVGVLIGNLSEMLFSEEKIASELAWYVLPEYRNAKIALQMFNAFEYWATHKMGADYITMVHLNDERLTKFYERKGYVKKEEAYMKEIR